MSLSQENDIDKRVSLSQGLEKMMSLSWENYVLLCCDNDKNKSLVPLPGENRPNKKKCKFVA